MSYERTGSREEPRRHSHRRRRRKNSRILYYVLLIGLLAILVFSAVKIISYLSQQKASEKKQNELINEFVEGVEVQPEDPNAEHSDGETSEEQPEETGSETKEAETKQTYVPEPDQISVDIAGLQSKYPDVKAWIYAANTGINYVVVKGSDNAYYLDHDLDGSKNNNGTLFIEQACDASFGSQNTIIYGHHMKSGRMFAPLENYKSQSYYDAHPYMYIYTAGQNYRIDLFAGFICEGNDSIYTTSVSADKLASCVSKSTFKSKIGTPTGKIVTLSTCDYTAGYEDARYVVLGELVPIS